MSQPHGVFREDIDGYTGPLIHLEFEKDASHIFCKAHPVPLAMQRPIEDELGCLQHQGILSPIHHSDWVTPQVPVRKNDGTLCLCSDYRSTVNAVAKKALYPLPTTAEVFANLRGGTLFSTLDLYQAYQQLIVDDETAVLLTVNTTKELFRVNGLPIRVSTEPAIFQRMMEVTLAGIPGVSVYLDDASNHGYWLEQVLARLSERDRRLRKNKCHFGITLVELLGYRIDANGVHATESKMKTILRAPKTTDKTSLRAFLGLISF
nr:uncharacterized protein K02A2.6-like [Rhipicephalus microplus]